MSLTPSDILSDPAYYTYLEGLAKNAAHSVARKFRVSVDDLTQEALLWCLSRPQKFMDYWNDEDQKRGARLITASMKNAATDFALKDQAAAGGSNRDTQVWYRGTLIEEILGYLWDDDAWLEPPQSEVKTRGSDPAHGNNWVTTLADVKRAVEKQSEYDQWVLRLYYFNKLSQSDIASLHADHCSQQKVGRAIRRALGRVRDDLGGRKPYSDPPEPGWGDMVGSRKAMSNAQADAITRAQRDGDTSTWEPQR